MSASGWIVACACGCAASIAAADPRPAPSAGDAEAGSVALEEVVVTARRVEERLQDTPISVTAFTAADLGAKEVRNVGDTAAFTPNFLANAGPTGGNDAFYFIRGVGQTDLNPATDPGVPTYVDGVYLGRVMGASIDASNVERVEVLRGPQGTLFGRNTIGGAVNVTTFDPGKQFGAQFTVGGGSRDLGLVRASADIPLSDTQGLRIAADLRDQNGWGLRLSDGTRFDTTNQWSTNLKYKWTPSELFSLTLAGDITHVTGTAQHTILIGFNPATVSPLGVPIPAGMGAYLNPSPYNNYSSINPLKDEEDKGVSLTLNWSFDGFDLKSISAYRRLYQFQPVDYDSSPYSFYGGAFLDDQHQFSQELNFSGKTGPASWLLGAYYYDERNNASNIVSLGGNNGCLPFPASGPPGDPFFFNYPVCNFAAGQQYATPGVNRAIVNNQQFTLQTKAKALFGQTTIHFTDHWSSTLGVRWTEEEKNQDYNFFIDNTAGVANLAGLPPTLFYTLSAQNPNNTARTDYERTWTQVTPKAGLEYKPAENYLYYFSYSKGFKSGGFDGRPNPNALTGQFGNITPFAPETLDSYEVGAKTQFLDNRVRFNVALFQENYKGIQLLAFDPQSGYFNTVTAASRIRGAELEFQARPVGAFQVDAGVGYLRDEYTSLPPPNTGILYGMELPLTPRVNGTLGAQYSWGIAQGTFTVRSDYSFRTQYWFQANNTPLSRQGGYGLLNGRVSYDFPGGHWSISGYGLNLANKYYLTNAQDVVAQLGIAFASVSPPRELGGELRYRFGAARP
jgi:iron complex outermembrane receptor protein